VGRDPSSEPRKGNTVKKKSWRAWRAREEQALRRKIYKDLCQVAYPDNEDGGFCAKDDERRDQFITSLKRGAK